jgi:hypothetical protein
MRDSSALSAEELWNPSKELSGRVGKLRDEYVNIYERQFHNEITPFTTGTDWDTLWSPCLWGVVPDLLAFHKSFLETLPLAATRVQLPPDFWEKPHMVRVAMFFREVVSRYLPVEILDGELIVGGQFNVALSRAQNRKEAKQWHKKTDDWLKQITFIDSHGMGNAGATPGHLIPDYPQALTVGLKGLVDHFKELRESTADTEHKDFLTALIICCEGAVRTRRDRPHMRKGALGASREFS